MDPHSNYRLRILQDLWRIVVLPSLIFSAVVHAEKWHLGLFRIPTYFAFLVFWAIIKRQWTVLLQHRETQRLAAVPIPCVVGKWPGNIDVLLRLMHDFKTSYILDAYLRLFEEYKCTTLNLRILWIDTIITMDQEHSRFALSTGFQYFWRGKMQKERLETFLGQGIFNRDDEQWKMHRAVARPFFARERISDFDIFEKHTAQTLSILLDLSSSNQACEAQDLFSRFSIDAASEFLFGKNLETLSASLPIPGVTKMGPKGSATEDTWGSFVHAFEMSQQEITRRARIGYFWPLFEMFNDRNKVHAKQIQAWLDPLVELALKQKSTTARFGTSPIVDQTFLQRLADSTDGDANSILQRTILNEITDLVLIRDQLLSMLLASRDTTSATLTFITYFMATHPDVAEKMRNEVLSICRVDPPTYEQMRQMKYVRAVINETLRLFPPVPLNTRESRSSCVLPTPDKTYPDGKPLFMPKNTTLTFLPLLTQRNAALWGDDADEFKPERWLEPERLGQFVANPTMYLPFSAGPRICVGQNYAYNQITYFLVRFLQQFSSCTLAPEYQPEGSVPPPEWKDRKGRQAIEKVWPGNAMTLYIKGGLWIRFHKS